MSPLPISFYPMLNFDCNFGGLFTKKLQFRLITSEPMFCKSISPEGMTSRYVTRSSEPFRPKSVP